MTNRDIFITPIVLASLMFMSICQAKAVENSFLVQGIEGPAKENVLKRLAQVKGQSVQTENFPLLKQIITKEVKLALQPYAYFHAKVRFSRQRHHGKTTIVLNIQPGHAMRIHQFAITLAGAGKQEPGFQQLIHNATLHQGGRLLIPDYNQLKLGFFHVAEQLGYINAKLTEHEIKIDVANNRAEVTLAFDTGPRYFFGPVTFQQTTLSPSLLNRYLTIVPGEPFTIKRLLLLQDTLRTSGYFNRVNMLWDKKLAKRQRIPIGIQLTPAPKTRYTFGLGYGTDTKVRGTFNYNQQPINYQGHRVETQVQASPIQSSMQFRYIVPGSYPPSDEYQWYTTAVRYHTSQNDSLASITGLSYQHTRQEWRINYNLNYLLEWRRATSDATALRSQWLYPSVNFKRVHASNPINALNGYRLNINLQSAYSGLFAHDSFIKALIEFKYIRTQGAFRLIFRESLGAIGTDDIRDLASHFQFYAGGGQSLRGYKFQAIGPGKYLHILSLELQTKLYREWRLGSFIDIGTAGNSIRHHFHPGVGLNLVRSTPIGSVEIGIAKPLSAMTHGINFIFSLGPDLA